MRGYTEDNPHRKPELVPTPAQRAAALVNDTSLELLRQDCEACRDAAAMLQAFIPSIEALDRKAGAA